MQPIAQRWHYNEARELQARALLRFLVIERKKSLFIAGKKASLDEKVRTVSSCHSYQVLSNRCKLCPERDIQQCRTPIAVKTQENIVQSKILA